MLTINKCLLALYSVCFGTRKLIGLQLFGVDISSHSYIAIQLHTSQTQKKEIYPGFHPIPCFWNEFPSVYSPVWKFISPYPNLAQSSSRYGKVNCGVKRTFIVMEGKWTGRIGQQIGDLDMGRNWLLYGEVGWGKFISKVERNGCSLTKSWVIGSYQSLLYQIFLWYAHQLNQKQFAFK